VKVTDLITNHSETFIIRGAWDTNPEHGVLSYLSPLAQVLLNKKVGEEVEFDMDGQKKRYRIDSVEASRPAASAG
jgi:transcription elongation GreA/GreB family factor